MSDYNMNFIPQGWQCPICKRVYSPSTTMCYSCGNEKFNVTTTTGEATIDWVKKISETFVKPEGWCSRRTKIEDCMEMMRNGWTPVGLEKENEDETY